jgi:hypothetical protein
MGMGLLEKFRRWLTTSSNERPIKAHPDLHPIDVEKLVRELNLKEEGRRLGSAGVPPPEAERLTAPEAAAVERVEKFREDYVDWGSTRLGVVNETLTKCDATQRANRAAQADQEFERKAASLLAENQSLIRNLGNAARQRKRELDAFRLKHSLMREAHYPAGWGKAFRVSLLAFLILFEGVVNANFFSQGLDTGWFGGAAYAGSLALVNVGIAFLMGLVPVRYVNHSSGGLKALGILAVPVALAAIVAAAFVISHLRDALTSELANPGAAALEALLHSPLGLKDLMSWVLFGLSILFALIALIDGLVFDDLYPGYGAIARRYREAFEDFDDELDSVRTALEALKDGELELLTETVRDSQSSLAVFAAAIDDKRDAESRLHLALRNADHALNAVVQVFRDENTVARNDLARPAYFEEDIKTAPPKLPDFSTDEDQARYSAQQAVVTELLRNVEAIRGRIQAAFTRQFEGLKPLDLHFAEGGKQ